jgi:D-glycero-D-manno-heptose 1,7-bisphosphate phosphatase
MGINEMNKAVFLDRDGVINRMVYNEKTGEYEPPQKIEELYIFDYVFDSLKKLLDDNFLLFVVSNQPDYAKGKTTLENLRQVHNALQKKLLESNISINEYFYCYHHPNGIIKEYTVNCECRKPRTFFVDNAVAKFQINREMSWFIGDRESDIQCGKNSGLNTIFINKNNENNFGADFSVITLKDAVVTILKNKI